MSQTAPAPTEHARLSPSSSSRWLVCPHSLSVKLPSPDNEASLEGTEAHGWAARLVMKDAHPMDVPERFRQNVMLYADHVLSNDVSTPPFVERRWDSLQLPDFSGTVDALLYENGTLIVYDYKNGSWPVEVEENTQLLSYAAIATDHFEIDTFYGVIVQPNAKSGRKIKGTDYSKQQVEDHYGRVKEAAASDEINPGFKQCMFCPLLKAGICEEGKTYARNSPLRNFKHLQDVPGL